MFEELERICERPAPFEFYTTRNLWTEEHTSAQMLSYHLNESVDAASRNSEFINRSVKWIVSRFNIGEGSTVADFGCGTISELVDRTRRVFSKTRNDPVRSL